MKPIKLTKAKISKLNKSIMDGYGEEINIFFMHGLFVSHLSSATLDTESLAKLLHGPNPAIPRVPNVYVEDVEYLTLLYHGLFDQTSKYCETQNSIIPMISLDKVCGDEFSYLELADNLQHNLLDWYMGYFYGFDKLWKHGIIIQFLEDHPQPLSSSGAIMGSVFVNAIATQHITAYNLITKLKPTYKSQLIKNVIANIKQQVSMISEDNFKIANQNAIECGGEMLASIRMLSLTAKHYYMCLQDLASGKQKVH